MHNSKLLLTCAVPLFLLAACATAPNVESRIGEATKMAVAQQTANPDAAKNTAAPTGLDGVAAAEAIGRYHQSFKSPPKTTNVFNIGVGSSSGSGNAGGNQ